MSRRSLPVMRGVLAAFGVVDKQFLEAAVGNADLAAVMFERIQRAQQ